MRTKDRDVWYIHGENDRALVEVERQLPPEVRAHIQRLISEGKTLLRALQDVGVLTEVANGKPMETK